MEPSHGQGPQGLQEELLLQVNLGCSLSAGIALIHCAAVTESDSYSEGHQEIPDFLAPTPWIQAQAMAALFQNTGQASLTVH